MTKPVIVATDGSEPATRAVEWAADEAVRRGLPLRIVHAVEPVAMAVPLSTPPGFRMQRLSIADSVLAQAMAAATRERPGLAVAGSVVHDSTAHGLRRQAEKSFELVLGQRGLGGFTGMLLGSVSLRVATRCAVPVVVVRGEHRSALDIDHEHGDIAVGIDPRKSPEAALAYAFDAALVRKARIRVVHGWRVLPALRNAEIMIDLGELDEAYRELLTKAVDPWRARFPEVEVIEESAPEHPVAALVRASAKASLVVVGAGHHAGLTAARLGSISHGVLHHAKCPVAVVPATS